MATPQPDHLLIVSGCIRRAPVRIPVAAALFTRSNLEFNLIMEGATMQPLRNLRTGTLLYTRVLKGMVPGQLLPGSHL